MGNTTYLTNSQIPLSNQVQSENYQIDNIDQPQQEQQTNLIINNVTQDFEFKIQKNQIIKALCTLFIIELFKLLLTTYIWIKIGKKFSIMAIFTFPLFFVAWLGLVIVNLKNKYSNILINYLIITSLIIFQSCFLFSFTRLFSTYSIEKGIQYLPYNENIYALNLTYQQIFCCLYILLITLYLLFEKQQVKSLIGFVFTIPIMIIILFVQPDKFIGCLISSIYCFLLLNVINQIISGKIQINQGEILQMTISMSIRVWIPCNLSI